MSKKILKRLKHYIQYLYIIKFDAFIQQQRKNPLSIPIIIINYNQLDNLRILVSFLLERKIENIIIVDNNSTYPPLLDYYRTIRDLVKVEIMNKNHGHMVFFENKILQEKYARGYYFVTDADIIPNENLPLNFIELMIKKMDKYNFSIQKVGFALDIKTIPDHYPLKQKVLNWESQYWKKELETDIFMAPVDTTFALYKPKYPANFKVKPSKFYRAIRLAGNFTCKHMGWYLDHKNLSEEQIYYINTSSESASWKFDNEGKLDSLSDY